MKIGFIGLGNVGAMSPLAVQIIIATG